MQTIEKEAVNELFAEHQFQHQLECAAVTVCTVLHVHVLAIFIWTVALQAGVVTLGFGAIQEDV